MWYTCEVCNKKFVALRWAKYCPDHRAYLNRKNRAQVEYGRMHKYCKGCWKVKPIEQFPLNTKGKRGRLCEECVCNGVEATNEPPCEPMGFAPLAVIADGADR